MGIIHHCGGLSMMYSSIMFKVGNILESESGRIEILRENGHDRDDSSDIKSDLFIAKCLNDGTIIPDYCKDFRHWKLIYCANPLWVAINGQEVSNSPKRSENE